MNAARVNRDWMASCVLALLSGKPLSAAIRA
jgi:hypothetical protein